MTEAAGFAGLALGIGGNLVVWCAYLLMRWSRPKPRRWDGYNIV